MPGDYPTNHFDDRRTGWNPYETALTTSNVNSSSFGHLWTAAVDSRVYTQPIVAMGESVAGGVHNVVFVGTMNDSLYAFDADTGAGLWSVSFLNPPAVQIVPQSFFGNCQTFGPSMGIVATPVYDRSTHSLYVLVATLEQDTSGAEHIHQRLHQINVADGTDLQTPVDIAGTTTYNDGTPLAFNPDVEPSRPALLESEGNIYIGFASFDGLYRSQSHGWVFAYNASTFAQVGYFSTERLNNGTVALGGPWMAGIGMSADANGNVFFATADGAWDGMWAFSDSVLKMTPTLDNSQVQFWTPWTYAHDNTNDDDLGSAGVMLLPPQRGLWPNLLWTGGKNKRAFLINADQLTGLSTTANKGYIRNVQTRAIIGGSTFYQDANGVAWVYDSDDSTNASYLAQYKISTGNTIYNYKIALLYRAPVPFGRIGGAEPIVSSNGSTPGSAIVWYTDRPAGTGPIPLLAFDASNISNELINVTAGQWTIEGTGALLAPTVANGKVYVASDYELEAFGEL